MDFGKSIGLLAAVAAGGIALYFFTRGKNGAAAAPEIQYGTVTVGGVEYPFPMTPGEHVISPGDVPQTIWPISMGEELLEPEYVPPPTYETQAPEADPLYRLGTPENPLYAEIPGELIPVSGWYESRGAPLGLTPAEFEAEWHEARVTPRVDLTPQQVVVSGLQPTMAGAEAYVDFKDRVILYGGDYVGGILVPPDTWQGSVTAFAQYIRASIDR